MEKYFKEYKDVGMCELDIDAIVKSKLYWNISQWENEYTLIRYTPKTERIKLKARISKEQAHILIGKLDLVNHKSTTFNSGSTWTKEKV